MENYKFYIKRIKFIKNLNDNEDIENLWVICLETGDMVVKVSNYLKKIALKDLESLKWYVNSLIDRRSYGNFYTKKVEFIEVNDENIHVIDNQKPIIYESFNSNKELCEGDFDELNFNGSVQPDNEDEDIITYDFGLFEKVNDEYKFIINSFVEYDKKLLPRNPKNIIGKDRYYEVKPYRCLERKKWEIKSLISSNEDENIVRLFD